MMDSKLTRMYNRLSKSKQEEFIEYTAKVELLREFAKKNGYTLNIDLMLK